MTERKPKDVSFETWVEKQIREAQERGAFDNLAGAGKPLQSLREPDDELWWVNQLMKREKLVHLPPTLALRKEAETVMTGVAALRSEAAVRAAVAELNAKILEAIRKPISGPPHNLAPYDVELAVRTWRDAQTVSEPQPEPTGRRSGRRTWWRRSTG